MTRDPASTSPDFVVRKLRRRGTRRFYLLAFLIYLPVLYSLAVIQARWYGWLAVGLSVLLLIGMRRTRAWHGLRIPMCLTAALVVALFALFAARPTDDVSLAGQIGRGTVRLFSRSTAVEQAFSGDEQGDRWRAPEGYTLTTLRLSTCTLEYLRVDAGAHERLVLQLHGGAFKIGLNDTYRRMALQYSEAAGGADVVSLDYRLSPEHPYPAQQQDALAAWDYAVRVLGYRPQNISVVGDSAGGNLTLSLCLRLRDLSRPLPRSLVCLSPWADLSNSGPSHTRNARVDVMFGVGDDPDYDGAPVGVDSPYADGLDARSPGVSPSFGQYQGFPPVLLQVGGDEVLLSDSEMVKAACDAAGVSCTLHVFPGMFHVFQASPFGIPECVEAWDEITAFLQK